MKCTTFLLAGVLVLAGAARADPSPFGTVLQRWPLQMSGSYAAAGVTWNRSEGMFYLMDQGYAGTARVWRLDPDDPPGTITEVPWTFANLGRSTTDIPMSIAWDDSAGCFWTGHILDGSIYGGCYLLRYVWDGMGWTWLGDPGDSWCISDTSIRGMLWIAALERNALDGLYWLSPVAGSPDTGGFLWALDPYTKTFVDSVRLIPRHSDARGLAMVPWDSAYFLTCGWNSDDYRMYDSTGQLLQAASAEYGPAGLAVLYPPDVQLDDTVCVYCINSHSQNYFERISTGMLWRQLPTALGQTVGISVLLAPAGVVDSGEAVVPTLVVGNHGAVLAETVSVHMLIDDEAEHIVYHESTTVALPPRSRDTLEFPRWTPVGRDSMGVTAWAHWAPDIFPEDDTLRSRVLVRVRNVGMAGVYNPIPGDTIDPGPLYPQAQVVNCGNVTETFPLVFGIDRWRDTVTVRNLLAGGSRTVTSQDSFPVVGDTLPWTCTNRTELDGDRQPDDDDTTFLFWVRGMVEHDLQLDITAPVGSLLVNERFTPIVLALNRGRVDESFWLQLTISDSSSSVLVRESIPATLPVGMQTHVAFPEQAFTLSGPYFSVCSAGVDPRHWETDSQSFWVCYSLGAEEEVNAPARYFLSQPEPNPFSRMTVVRFGLPEEAAVDLAVYSMDGRRVKGLTKRMHGSGYHRVVWDGKDDAGKAVSRGVYCIRLAAGGHEAGCRVVKLE